MALAGACCLEKFVHTVVEVAPAVSVHAASAACMAGGMRYCYSSSPIVGKICAGKRVAYAMLQWDLQCGCSLFIERGSRWFPAGASCKGLGLARMLGRSRPGLVRKHLQAFRGWARDCRATSDAFVSVSPRANSLAPTTGSRSPS